MEDLIGAINVAKNKLSNIDLDAASNDRERAVLQELKDKLQALEDKMKAKKKKHSEAVFKYYKARAEKDEVFREKEKARHRKKYEANKEASIQR
jgi:hypothetical protein